MSLSGCGHSITPCGERLIWIVIHNEYQAFCKSKLTRYLALILCNNSGSIPAQAEAIALVLRSVSPSRADVCEECNISSDTHRHNIKKI